MRRVRAGLAGLTLVAVIATAGCAVPNGMGRPGGPNRLGVPWYSCEVDPLAPQNDGEANLSRLPEDFVPVSAVVCDTVPDERADGSVDSVKIEARTDDINEIVTAMRLPDIPRTDGACTMELRAIPGLALLDAQGQWTQPRAPMDACGHIRSEVMKAVESLKLTRVSETKVGEIVSPEAAAAGCSQGAADIVWAETVDSVAKPATSGIDGFAEQTRSCVYTVSESERGGSKPAGEFEYGGILTDDRWAAIKTELRAAGSGRACTTPASRFAVLTRVDKLGGEIYVELDGCQRILTTPIQSAHLLAQAGPALVDLLGRG